MHEHEIHVCYDCVFVCRLLHSDVKETGLLNVMARLIKSFASDKSPRSHGINLVHAVHSVLRMYDRLTACESGMFMVKKKKARAARKSKNKLAPPDDGDDDTAAQGDNSNQQQPASDKPTDASGDGQTDGLNGSQTAGQTAGGSNEAGQQTAGAGTPQDPNLEEGVGDNLPAGHAGGGATAGGGSSKERDKAPLEELEEECDDSEVRQHGQYRC